MPSSTLSKSISSAILRLLKPFVGSKLSPVSNEVEIGAGECGEMPERAPKGFDFQIEGPRGRLGFSISTKNGKRKRIEARKSKVENPVFEIAGKSLKRGVRCAGKSFKKIVGLPQSGAPFSDCECSREAANFRCYVNFRRAEKPRIIFQNITIIPANKSAPTILIANALRLMRFCVFCPWLNQLTSKLGGAAGFHSFQN